MVILLCNLHAKVWKHWKQNENSFFLRYPKRVSCNQRSAALAQQVKAPEQAQVITSPWKMNVTIKSPVGDISVVTLIRTDTTLDHSQKAEKVWLSQWLLHFINSSNHLAFGTTLFCSVHQQAIDHHTGAGKPASSLSLQCAKASSQSKKTTWLQLVSATITVNNDPA